MATTTASSPPHIDHPDLRRYLGALRVQLWWRDGLVVAAATMLCGALIGTLAVLWPGRQAWFGGSGPTFGLWFMVAAVIAGTLAAAVRRPTIERAARVADRQLNTASRLATAAQVLDGRLTGGLAAAQLDDAWRTASAIEPVRAFPSASRGVRIALLVMAASLVIVVLSAMGVLSPWELPGGVGSQVPTDNAAVESAASPDTSVAADPLAIAADPSTNPAAAAQTLEALQAAAAQSQANEAALQKLADALRSTSAARDVGEALRRGDYEDAANRLVTLARDADQLSRSSKRELATALQRAAYQSAQLDPPLAVAEDAAQRALNRQVYSETRAALENLARTVTDAQKGVVSQDDLAKSLDQLQQQQQPTAGGGGGEDPEGYIPDIPGENPKQVGLVKGLTSTIQVPGPEGDPRTATRSGVGTEAGGDPLGDLASRLNVPPVDLNIDALLANDRGREKANPAAPTVKISDTNQNGVRQSDVVQPGEPVQDVAEQTIEASTQRDTVRSFFKSAGDPNQVGGR